MNRAPADPVPILIQAGLLLSKPENWCQGALARRKGGAPLQNPAASSAKSWDVLGAIYASAGVNPQRPKDVPFDKVRDADCAVVAVHAAANRLYKMSAERVNDERTHADALALLRAAIRHERASVPPA